DLAHMQRVDLAGGKGISGDIDLAGNKEVGQLGDVRQDFEPLLNLGQDLHHVVVVEGPFAEPLRQLLQGEGFANPDAVEPAEFGDVEYRAAQGHALQIEVFLHFIQGELFPLVGHGPAHAAQVVDNGFGQEAHAAVVV